MKEVPDIIEGGRQLIRDGWTQLSDAKNAQDQHVDAWDPHATQFCSIGAIKRCAGMNADLCNDALWHVGDCARELLRQEGHEYRDFSRYEYLMTYNDATGRTRDEVIALFDHALDTLPKGDSHE